jgi:hypothetical protein
MPIFLDMPIELLLTHLLLISDSLHTDAYNQLININKYLNILRLNILLLIRWINLKINYNGIFSLLNTSTDVPWYN